MLLIRIYYYVIDAVLIKDVVVIDAIFRSIPLPGCRPISLSIPFRLFLTSWAFFGSLIKILFCSTLGLAIFYRISHFCRRYETSIWNLTQAEPCRIWTSGVRNYALLTRTHHLRYRVIILVFYQITALHITHRNKNNRSWLHSIRSYRCFW